MAYARAPQTKLTLNAVLIDFPMTDIRVGRQPFHSGDVLKMLRNEHASTHVLKRRGNSIIDVPVAVGAEPIGTPETFNLTSDLGICRALVLNAYLNYISALKRPILNFDPVDFLAEDDLLADSVPDGVACPDWLSVRLRYQIDVGIYRPDRGNPILRLALGTRTAWVISANCARLLRGAVRLHGLYVQEVLPSNDPRVQGKKRLLGRVVDLRNGELILADTHDDRDKVRAEDVYLEPRKENLLLCIRSTFGREAETVIRQLQAKIAQLNDGSNRLARVQRILDHLRAQNLEIVPGIRFTLGKLLSQSDSHKSFPPVTREGPPVYVFGPGASTDSWHDRGLDTYGPYDQSTFTPTSPRIAVICQARHRGQTELFLRKLRDGVPTIVNSKGRQPFGKGMLRKYCLNKWFLEFFEAKAPSSDAYRDAISRAVEYATEHNEPWDLALVQIEERFHELHGDANPYLVSKAAFLQRNVPSQEVEIETMQAPDSQLVYILNNIALAIYAKLGGIPWLLQANRGIAHELVFGLGSASVGEGRLGSRERIVGITTVFSGDGNYLLENRSRAVTMDEYSAALLESLKSAIERVRQIMNWQPRDSVRLVFHAFKPFRKEQIAAVQELLRDLRNYEVQCAFLHVVENHPYLLFDEGNQDGVWDAQSRLKKGRLAPPRGLWLQLGDRESLLVLTGAREVKRPEDGLPTPLLLRLDSSSTFKDMKYLTGQVYHFSCHSWRSFLPSPLPITMLYSGLIASLLGKLCRLSKWDSQAMLSPIGRTRWFL